MNENIDLTKILKDCPKGTKFYSSLFGEVEFNRISNSRIVVEYIDCLHRHVSFNKFGRYVIETLDITYFSSECLLFPSKEQRDWSKFTAPWLKKESTSSLLKKEKFDPKLLNPFDKVLVRNTRDMWRCGIFSHINYSYFYPYIVSSACFKYCIPYNDDTKHLVGTTDEAPARIGC